MMSLQEAKKIWKDTNPLLWTAMHSNDKDLAILSSSHLHGFLQGLALTGQIPVSEEEATIK